MSDELNELRVDYKQLVGLLLQTVESGKDNAVAIAGIKGQLGGMEARLLEHMDDEEGQIIRAAEGLEALTAEVKEMRELCVDSRHCEHHEWVEDRLTWRRRREEWFSDTGSQALRMIALAVGGMMLLWIGNGFLDWLNHALGSIK